MIYLWLMKYSTRLMNLMALIAIITIIAYQTYWLVNIYRTIDDNLQKELQEVLRSADFEEIIYRVNAMRDDHVGGKMDISVGVDSSLQKTTLTNERKKRLTDEKTDTNLKTTMPKSEFPDALREADDVINVGLNMQSAIHSGLDRMRGPNLKTLERVVERRLDSLDIHVPHAILYLQTNGHKTDTLAVIGDTITQHADIFHLRLDINAQTEYQLLMTKRPFIVLMRMKAILLFSLLTLLMLILAFWYARRLTKRLKAIDEMKSEFSNNITHELKTPIAVAYAANDALLNVDAANDPEIMHNYLKISIEQLNQRSRMVEQILALTTEQQEKLKLHMTNVNVNDVIRELVNIHQLKNNGKVHFEILTDPDLVLNTDQLHFSNIVSNLIDNAIKYSEKEPKVTINAHHDGHQLEISVKDNGIGIARTNLPFIFDRFYRVPHGNLYNVKGYGLGLYYVKQMVQRLGGNVTVHSKEGEGSIFTLTFKVDH